MLRYQTNLAHGSSPPLLASESYGRPVLLQRPRLDERRPGRRDLGHVGAHNEARRVKVVILMSAKMPPDGRRYSAGWISGLREVTRSTHGSPVYPRRYPATQAASDGERRLLISSPCTYSRLPIGHRPHHVFGPTHTET